MAPVAARELKPGHILAVERRQARFGQGSSGKRFQCQLKHVAYVQAPPQTLRRFPPQA